MLNLGIEVLPLLHAIGTFPMDTDHVHCPHGQLLECTVGSGVSGFCRCAGGSGSVGHAHGVVEQADNSTIDTHSSNLGR